MSVNPIAVGFVASAKELTFCFAYVCSLVGLLCLLEKLLMNFCELYDVEKPPKQFPFDFLLETGIMIDYYFHIHLLTD